MKFVFSLFLSAVNPLNQPTSGSTSSFTVAERLASAIPLQEPKAVATNRLDQIIHQNESGAHFDGSTTRSSNQTDGFYENTEQAGGKREFQSRSSSSSSSSARPPTKDSTSLGKKNSLTHRSLDALPRPTSEIDSQMKATSMDINPRTAASYEPFQGKDSRPFERHDDESSSLGSIYFTPAEASHPASAYQNTCKGWLRKQNRGNKINKIASRISSPFIWPFSKIRSSNASNDITVLSSTANC